MCPCGDKNIKHETKQKKKKQQQEEASVTPTYLMQSKKLRLVGLHFFAFSFLLKQAFISVPKIL